MHAKFALVIAALGAVTVALLMNPRLDTSARNSGAKNYDPELTLEVSAGQIRVGDPLFFKAKLANRGSRSIRMTVAFAEEGGLRLQYRRPGETEYSSYVSDRARVALTLPPLPWDLRPEAQKVVYLRLFRFREDLFFIMSGTYEFRAVVRIADVDVVSKPVTVTVGDAPEKERLLIWKHDQALDSMLDLREVQATGENAARALNLYQDLTPSYLKQCLTVVRETVSRPLGNSSQLDAAAVRDLCERIKSRSDPIFAEWLVLRLAQRRINKGHNTEGSAWLEQIKESSHLADSLRHEAGGSLQWQKRVAAFFPEDKRLDKQVEHLATKPSTFGEIIASFSKQGGIPLDGNEKTKERSMMFSTNGSLRQLMLSVEVNGGGKWVPRGEGYYLEAAKIPGGDQDAKK